MSDRSASFDVADDVRMADSISIAHCEHGMVYVRLHDAAGTVFAAGAMDFASAERLSGHVGKHAAEARTECGGIPPDAALIAGPGHLH